MFSILEAFLFPSVGSFASPGIDTVIQKGPTVFSVSSERHRKCSN